MGTDDQKAILHRYLRTAREALLWKHEGLSEYDARRPLTPTGTNLLGLAETQRHAGHADIVRDVDWVSYVQRVEGAAATFRAGADG